MGKKSRTKTGSTSEWNVLYEVNAYENCNESRTSTERTDEEYEAIPEFGMTYKHVCCSGGSKIFISMRGEVERGIYYPM